jgi:hypothetical protein
LSQQTSAGELKRKQCFETSGFGILNLVFLTLLPPNSGAVWMMGLSADLEGTLYFLALELALFSPRLTRVVANFS